MFSLSLGLCRQQLQVIGGKPVSQTQILAQSQMHASAINKEELKTDYKDDVPTRYKEIYKGNIGKSLKKHFIAALRLPLHPLAGKPNQPYDPATKDKSPLSHAALAFVHAGFSLKHRTLLDRFPETINRVSASLLETMQNWYPTPIAYPYELGEKPRSPPCMHLYIPLNFTSLT